MSEKKIPYWQKLQDPQWQKKRLEVLDRDGFMCRKCGDETKTLDVHHEYYIAGREPWDYPMGSFLTLCRDCHKQTKADSKHFGLWEHFKNLLEETDRIQGAESNFIHALLLCSHTVEWPMVEILSLLADAMESHVIDLETLKAWQADLKALREKREVYK